MKKVFTLLAALLLISGIAWAQTVTWTAADQGYENGQVVEAVDFDDYVSASFFQGTNSNNPPKYYNTGSAIRCYGGNYFTVTSDYPLTEITLGFASGEGTNEITTDCGTYTDGTWTGNATEVTFTIGGTSGHRRIATFAITYTQSGAPVPSINASNVEIAYNATTGSIGYSVNNPVSGGTLTASAPGYDWITMGNVGSQEVSFTCSANSAPTERTANVTLTYTYNTDQTATKNITVTQAANPNATNNISDITAAGTYTVQGTIVAINARGFIVGDGTGYVYYYYGNGFTTNFTEGDIVRLSGSVVVYGGVFEFNSSTTVTEADDSNFEDENPVVLSGEDMDARVGSTTPPQLSSYIQYEGTLSVTTDNNNVHYNVTGIVGASTAIGSISYPLNAEEVAALDGKHVKVTGYYVGVSTSTYYNTMLGIIEETVTYDPSIAAENVDINYNATSGAITYTIDNPVSGGVLSASTESDWLTLGTVGTTVPFTCTANTTASARTATVTLTYTYNTDQFVTKNITVTQAGNPNTLDNISDITAAGNYTVQGTIVAKNQRGFIVGDGTGYVYYYYGTSGFEPDNYNIGDMVKLSGAVVVYGGVFEFNNTTTITTATSSSYVAENPTVLTGEDMDARVASTTPPQLSSYVQYEGTLSVNGNYFNITNILGATVAQGSISFPLNSEDITALDGKLVTVTGYYVGISSGTYYNTMLGSIVENTNPSITISDANLNIGVEGASGTLAVTYMNINQITPSVYFCNAEGAASSYNWITASIDATNNVSYTVNANTGEARTAYLKVKVGNVYSNLVTINQAEYAAPGTWVLADLTDLTENDIFVIVGNNGNNFALPNDGGTSAPAAIAVTVVEGTLSGEPADNLQWHLSLTEDGYIFYPNGTTESWLYCTNSNNGVRVGDGDAKHFTMDETYGYLTTTETDDQRYIGIYNSQDWRCYKLGSDGSFPSNIDGQTFAFYKKTTDSTTSQTVVLVSGANWFSANVEITLTDLQNALTEALPNTSITIKASGSSTSYKPNMHRWVGQLNENLFSVAQLYLITVTADAEITLEGTRINPAELPITIVKGTNWIAYPLSESMSLDDAFAGFAANGDVVKSQNSSARRVGSRWIGQLTELTPGQGYLFTSNQNNNRTLIFPTSK